MPRKVRIVKAMRWVHTANGQRVSIYGPCPWTHPNDRKYWEMREVGWTTYNISDNTYGFGRMPFATKEGLESWLRSYPDQFEIVP